MQVQVQERERVLVQERVLVRAQEPGLVRAPGLAREPGQAPGLAQVPVLEQGLVPGLEQVLEQVQEPASEVTAATTPHPGIYVTGPGRWILRLMMPAFLHFHSMRSSILTRSTRPARTLSSNGRLTTGIQHYVSGRFLTIPNLLSGFSR